MDLRATKNKVLHVIGGAVYNPRLVLLEERYFSNPELSDVYFLGVAPETNKVIEDLDLLVTDKSKIAFSKPVLGLGDNYELRSFGIGLGQRENGLSFYLTGPKSERQFVFNSEGELSEDRTNDYKPNEFDKWVAKAILEVAKGEGFKIY